jgi:hypothetical protein
MIDEDVSASAPHTHGKGEVVRMRLSHWSVVCLHS